MKLSSFRAAGCRCLESISWIPLKDLIILTGPNDGGKTTILDAIGMFLNQRALPEQEDYTFINGQNKCDQIILEGIFSLSSAEQEKLGDGVEEEIHIRKICNRAEGSIIYQYKTQIHSDRRLRRDLNSITVNELRELADEFEIELSNRQKKSIIVSHFREWLKDQPLGEGYLDLSSDILNMFPEIKIFRSSETLDPESEINSTLKNSFSTRIRGERYSGRLEDIETEIQAEMREDLNEFEEILKKYCPDISTIQIDPYFDFARGFQDSRLLLRKRDGPLIELDKEGEGRKRHITLAVHEWREKIFADPEPEDRPIDLILAYDEPDTHLDYMSQRKILDMIRRISEHERNNVIICTHSLNLIDRLPITDIVHIKLIDDRTNIEILQTDNPELIDTFLYNISDSMGLKNSIMLNERLFFLVEGETEIYALNVIYQKLFEYSLQAGGIRLLNGGGCGGVRTLAKFLNDNRRNVLFLVDNDTRTNPGNRAFTPDKLERDGFDLDSQVFFIGTQEFEDSFSDDLYLKTAKRYWGKHDGSEWSLEEFSQLRDLDNFTDGLLRLLRCETRSMISKSQIGLSLAKSIDSPDEIPEIIKECFQAANRLAS